jgi:hypothetical protein
MRIDNVVVTSGIKLILWLRVWLAFVETRQQHEHTEADEKEERCLIHLMYTETG